MMNFKKYATRSLMNAGMVFMSLSLVGCNLHTPTAVSTQKIQLNEKVISQDVAVSEINDAFIDGLVRHYTKHGNSVMDLVLTYDPKSYRNTAMKATNHVSDVVTLLRDRGVVDVKASIMPIKSQGDEARLLVSYSSVSAHAPEECKNNLLGGLGERPVEFSEEYKLGCSVKSMTARQVAKPSHLTGRGNTDGTTDGRGSTNVVDTYRTGAQNAPLDGESATGDN